MIPLATLFELFDYNYWARDQQFKACARLTRKQFTEPLGGSFSSVRDTLTHLVFAEWVWLERWEGRNPTAWPSEQFDTLPPLEAYWRKMELRMREHLAGLDPEGLGATLTYTNFKGEMWSYARWRTMVHVINHQSYHRGQITNMLRQLGVEPPAVDLLVAHDLGFRT